MIPTSYIQPIGACLVVGLLGGALMFSFGVAPLTTALLLGAIYGVVFAVLGIPRASSPGAGLLWGLGYALLVWLLGPAGVFSLTGDAPTADLLANARSHFPELCAYLICFGLPLGLALGSWGLTQPNPTRPPFSIARALIVGGLA